MKIKEIYILTDQEQTLLEGGQWVNVDGEWYWVDAIEPH